jgi:monoamine oxidase
VTLDLGGQWIGPGQSRIAALADELGVDTYPQYDDGDDVVVRAGTVVRVASPALAFAKEELLGYLELVAALEALADTVPTDAPWQAPKAAALDRQTLATWIDGRNVPDAATELFEVGVQAVFAATSADLSLLHVAHYVAAAGGWSALTDTTGGAQERRIVGGLEPLARRLAEQLPGGVQLDSEVLGLDWDRDNDGVTVTVQRRAPAAVGSDLGGTMGPGGLHRSQDRMAACPPGDRRRAANRRPAHRLRSAVAARPRSTHGQHARRLGDQISRHLPDAVLAGGRSVRSGDRPWRCRRRHLRQHRSEPRA